MRFSRAGLLVGVLLASLSGCYPHQGGSAPTGAARNVDVIEVRRQQVSDTLTLVGRIEPGQEATLYFEVPGVVQKVFVSEGDVVEAGAPVAQLVSTDFELKVAQASAELTAAKARLSILEEGTRKEDLLAARAAHAQAVARANYWTGELARRQRLYDRRTLTASELGEAKREQEASLERQREAKALLDRAIAGPRKQEIEEAAALVEAHTSALALANRELAKATLRAPFAGRVERRMLDAGALVQLFPAGSLPVVHLVDLSTVEAAISLPEPLVDRFTPGQEVEVAAAVDSTQRAAGQVVAVGQVSDRASGTYELRVRLENPERTFASGMVVNTIATTTDPRPTILIPTTAVRQPYGQPSQVLLVDAKSVVVARDVRLGEVRGDRVAVTAGLSGGELVIVRGQHLVVAGDRVRANRLEDRPAEERKEPSP
jgi:multidrug efflux pump subunit AcrA (membrane-fusion protein)